MGCLSSPQNVTLEPRKDRFALTNLKSFLRLQVQQKCLMGVKPFSILTANHHPAGFTRRVMNTLGSLLLSV